MSREVNYDRCLKEYIKVFVATYRLQRGVNHKCDSSGESTSWTGTGFQVRMATEVASLLWEAFTMKAMKSAMRASKWIMNWQ